MSVNTASIESPKENSGRGWGVTQRLRLGLMVLLLAVPTVGNALEFGPQQIITVAADGPRSIFAADLDGDGDLDLLLASVSDDKVAWYENVDGAGTFGPQQVITLDAINALSVFATDLDVLSASGGDHKVAWYENTDGAGSFGPQQVIIIAADNTYSVFAADLDGDGDPDVLSASADDGNVAWYENMDGAGNFGPELVISTAVVYARSVSAADLDGDGDQDVLSASQDDDKIAWYENTDGAGSFGPQQIITIAADHATSVFPADLDGDGDMDVLSSSALDAKVAWYENMDGAGSFGSQQVISTDADWAYTVFAADLDGDGDMDVLSASWADDKVAWYENTDGAGSFGPQQVINSPVDTGARSVLAADLDGDGDQDVLSASAFDDKVAWYENLGSEDPGACSDNSGQLDIGTSYATSGATGTATLTINTTPNTVAALGFEVAFDSTKLTYTGFNRGALTTEFDFFDISNPAAGIVRIGGFEGGTDKIAVGASGTLVELLFTVDPAVPAQTEIPLGLQGLVDDLAPFTTSTGCLITGCSHDGEVNGDGVITPRDALLAYEFYLELTELDECEQDHADVSAPVDPGSDITPGDALCILQKYLGIPSCLD